MIAALFWGSLVFLAAVALHGFVALKRADAARAAQLQKMLDDEFRFAWRNARREQYMGDRQRSGWTGGGDD